MSWFNPPPFDAPIRYPKQIPKAMVPSLIGEAGQVLNLLMHEGAGNVVKDYSGLGNHGTIYGATWIDGEWGWALFFNGVSAYVNVADIPHSDTITVEAWFNPTADAISKTYAYIVTKRAEDMEWQLLLASGAVYWQIWQSGGPWVGGTFTDTLSPDTWYHFAGVADGSYVRGYLNGVEVGTPFAYDGTIYDASALVVVGQDNVLTANRYFNGVIGVVRVYDRPLTPEEIRYHYESTKALFGV